MRTTVFLVGLGTVLAAVSACLPPEPDFTAPAAPELTSVPEFTNGQAANALTSGNKEPGSAVYVSIAGGTPVELVGNTAEGSWTDAALPTAILDALQAGQNDLTFTARDGVGNVSVPVSQSIGLDRVPPVGAPTVTGPAYGAYITDGMVTFTWDEVLDDPSEFSGIGTYQVELSTTPTFDGVLQTEDSLGPAATLTVAAPLPVARYWFRVAAVDKAGNRAVSDGSDTVFSGVRGDLDGDRRPDFVIGAPGQDGATQDTGSAFVYRGGTNLSGLTPYKEVSGPGGQFAAAGKVVADLNGDGLGDLVVGGPAGSGYVRIYFGSTAGLSDTADVVIGGEANSEFGLSLDAADLNGDGYADLLVGAPGYSDTGVVEGRAYLFLGGQAWPATMSALTDATTIFNGGMDVDRFGESVAVAGKVDAGPLAHVVVGAPNRNLGLGDEGEAWLFALQDPLPATMTAGGSGAVSLGSVAGPPSNAHFGLSVASGVDLDGDGANEIVVGAPQDTIGGNGRVYLIYRATTLACQVDRTTQSALNHHYGWSVAVVESFNGTPAIVGGLPNDGNGGSGGVVVTPVDPANRCQFFTPVLLAGTNSEGLGASVAAAGDLNGDGDTEIIAGAPGFSSQAGRGAVLEWEGSLLEQSLEPVASVGNGGPPRVGAAVGGVGR